MSAPALNRWLFLQAVLWTPALVLLALGSGGAELEPWKYGALGIGLLLSFGHLWRVLGTGRHLADLATLLRFLGLAGLCAGLAVRPSLGWAAGVTWGLWVGFLLVVLGDLVDGWVARRFGGSEAGAILDMETDQFTLIVLAVTAMASGAGPWPLIVPGIRYQFILAMRALRIPHHDPKPIDGDNRRGRWTCALVTGLLLGCSVPGLPGVLRVALGLVAVAALAWSYTGDVRFLLSRYRAASG